MLPASFEKWNLGSDNDLWSLKTLDNICNLI